MNDNASIGIVVGIIATCIAIFGYFIDVDFVKGFGLFIVHVGLTATIGGGIGVGLAILIDRSQMLAESVIRVLRLGHWLPFYMLWALPTWKPAGSRVADVTLSEMLVSGTMLVVPIIFFSSCYFKLTSIVSARSQLRDTGFTIAKFLLLHSVLICVLWQMWLPSLGWPWHWAALSPSPVVGTSVLLLLGSIVWFVNECSRFSAQESLDVRRAVLLWELKKLTVGSLGGAMLIVILSVLLWELWKDGLKKYLLIAPPSEVLKAIYKLLISGSTVIPNGATTLWRDINVSLIEAATGLMLAGLCGLALTRLSQTGERANRNFSKVLMLTEIAPIGLWISLLATMIPGFVPFWSKATLAACLSFYPFTHTLRSFDDYPLLCRLLLALEQALPFAFVGMILSEMFGGTAGLSFVATVAGASLQVTEAVATALVEFGLLACISIVIRLTLKHVFFSESYSEAVASTDGQVSHSQD